MEPKCDLPSTLSLSSSSLLSTLLFSHQYQYQHQHSLQTNQRNQENVMLATSSSDPRLQREQTSADAPSPPPLDKFVLPGNNKTTTDTSHLCSDQQGFLDHLKPRSLFISVSSEYMSVCMCVCVIHLYILYIVLDYFQMHLQKKNAVREQQYTVSFSN
jgi:hypothetical protein